MWVCETSKRCMHSTRDRLQNDENTRCVVWTELAFVMSHFDRKLFSKLSDGFNRRKCNAPDCLNLAFFQLGELFSKAA